MSEPANEPIGPQAAAAAVLEVEAIPDDGTAAPPGATPQPSEPAPEAGGGPTLDESTRAWRETIFVAIAAITGAASQRWKSLTTTHGEAEVVADAWAPICARRWPTAMTPEIAAAMITLGVFAPKIKGAFTEEREARAAKKAADAQARARAAEQGPISDGS